MLSLILNCNEGPLRLPLVRGISLGVVLVRVVPQRTPGQLRVRGLLGGSHGRVPVPLVHWFSPGRLRLRRVHGHVKPAMF